MCNDCELCNIFYATAQYNLPEISDLWGRYEVTKRLLLRVNEILNSVPELEKRIIYLNNISSNKPGHHCFGHKPTYDSV